MKKKMMNSTGKNQKTKSIANNCRNSSNSRSLNNFEEVVLDYILHHRSRAEDELKYFKLQPSFQEAIEMAALAKSSDGKKHSHQCSIRQPALEEARDRLLGVDLKGCSNFSELIEIVDATIRPIKGIGELAVYDTTLRIGAYLNLKPDVIYLHSGTRDGAKAIGLDGKRHTIYVDELPSPFQELSPREIEDCLCIYKDDFKGFA